MHLLIVDDKPKTVPQLGRTLRSLVGEVLRSGVGKKGLEAALQGDRPQESHSREEIEPLMILAIRCGLFMNRRSNPFQLPSQYGRFGEDPKRVIPI